MRKLNYQDWKGGSEVVTSQFVKDNWANLNGVHKWVDSAEVGDKWEFKGNHDDAVFKLECIDVLDDAGLIVYYEDDHITIGVRSAVPFKRRGNDFFDGDFYFHYVNVPIETDSTTLLIGQYKVVFRNSSYFTFHDGMIQEYTIDLYEIEGNKKLETTTLDAKEVDNG
jgi:hypothetical protein